MHDQFQTGLPTPPWCPGGRRWPQSDTSLGGGRHHHGGRSIIIERLSQSAKRLITKEPRNDPRPEPTWKVRHDVQTHHGNGWVWHFGRHGNGVGVVARQRRPGCHGDSWGIVVVAGQQRCGEEQFTGVWVELWLAFNYQGWERNKRWCSRWSGRFRGDW